MAWKILFSVVLSFFIGQTIKAILHYHQYHKVNLWVFLEDGGMPSAHAVVTFSLTSALFYQTGVSPLFVTALVFTLVILNDTMKVSRKPGIQSELMAKFIDVREIIRRKLTEGVTHTPLHVFSGIILGFLVSSMIYAF